MPFCQKQFSSPLRTRKTSRQQRRQAEEKPKSKLRPALDMLNSFAVAPFDLFIFLNPIGNQEQHRHSVNSHDNQLGLHNMENSEVNTSWHEEHLSART